ncbi:succinyldiaminopimelate transaminase [Leucobacter exalbidus]|uniref:Aminotransferase n=1 Tax=Leucobacter exalbidus TaxID=662960 RepID=A0A940PYD0_9MICO|nr:succinyldiaminopimelate transaminase [Leucobacter exalbidus]MBP1327624.1 succinyldiaminopimelate transaminase [Leucobacter exalbidus]
MRGALPDYPWDAMAPYAQRAAEHPEGALNLSIGSPVDAAPEAVQRALGVASDAHGYPATAGTSELQAAIADWMLRRRGVTVAADAVLPTIGSKELVALLPFLLGLGKDEAVVFPRVAYPSYAMGAALVGADAIASDEPAEWPENTRLVWLNSPSNPDGRVLDVEALRAAVSRARELGAVIVGDECYAEFAWQEPWKSEGVPSILDPRVVGDDHTGVLSAYSLSKQSNLAGYRAAFVAGDAALISQLLTVRKHAGLMQPGPVQRAMVAALGDELHVAQQYTKYEARRAQLQGALESMGYRIDGSEAGLYLWATRGVDAWESIAEFAEIGILAGPGVFYGDHSPQHVRLAITATDADIAAAAARMRAQSMTT